MFDIILGIAMRKISLFIFIFISLLCGVNSTIIAWALPVVTKHSKPACHELLLAVSYDAGDLLSILRRVGQWLT